MKQLFLVLLVLPLAVLAQYRFDPVRLDDGQDSMFYGIHLGVENDGNIFCTWTGEDAENYRACGRSVTPAGLPAGNVKLYALEDIDSAGGCFPYVRKYPLVTGGEVRHYAHS